MRRLARLVVISCGLTLLLGCGGDDDSADRAGEQAAGDEDGPRLEEAGDAAAAAGAGLREAPGPADRRPLDGFGEVAIAITDADGETVGWCVLLAATDEQRQRGLMEVVDLGGYAGMLFVWAEDASSSFYMRNTPMPLSIAWFGADGDLVSTADMDPCGDLPDCPFYPADGSYRFALEVPQGQLGELGVEEGSRMRVGGQCAPSG